VLIHNFAHGRIDVKNYFQRLVRVPVLSPTDLLLDILQLDQIILLSKLDLACHQVVVSDYV
jgi:hypothetical protein